MVAGITARGKSELHRARCWVTPSEGDLKDSATERYRLAFLVTVLTVLAVRQMAK